MLKKVFNDLSKFKEWMTRLYWNIDKSVNIPLKIGAEKPGEDPSKLIRNKSKSRVCFRRVPRTEA